MSQLWTNIIFMWLTINVVTDYPVLNLNYPIIPLVTSANNRYCICWWVLLLGHTSHSLEAFNEFWLPPCKTNHHNWNSFPPIEYTFFLFKVLTAYAGKGTFMMNASLLQPMSTHKFIVQVTKDTRTVTHVQEFYVTPIGPPVMKIMWVWIVIKVNIKQKQCQNI